MENPEVVIVGAGIAGLIAAIHLEKSDIHPLIIEKDDRPGGRVKTYQESGFLLDHGFQVLLTNYPETRKYLDYERLSLKTFQPGAIILSDNKIKKLGNPLKEKKLLWPTIRSSAATFSDKMKLWSITNKLKKRSIEKIFDDEDIRTSEFLKNQGFSDKIIKSFFTPFFRGIFLEKELDTSSRMFQFVLKMFAEGYAAIPANGIEEITIQLYSKLKNSKFRFNSQVDQVGLNTLTLMDGEEINFSKLIVSTEPSSIIPALHGQFKSPKKTTCLYFEAEASPIKENLLILMKDDTNKKIVNNLCVLTDVAESYSKTSQSLISVTLIGLPELTNEELVIKVKSELRPYFKSNLDSWHFLKRFDIPYALPHIDDLTYDIKPSETKIKDNIFLAGDFLLYPSLNAAMTSGRRAAEALLASIT